MDKFFCFGFLFLCSGLMTSCTPAPSDSDAASVPGTYAPPAKSAAQQAGAMIAPVTH